MNKPERIDTDKAPGAVGPYSQAMSTANLVYTSGQLGINPANKIMPEDVREQASMCLNNLKAILEAAGSGLDKVLKATVFLTDMSDFAAVNEVYAGFFSQPYPARSCFAVKALPLGAKVEIEVVAMR
jgi:2-iminobutanoate/2-iminopropanoate deaminase